MSVDIQSTSMTEGRGLLTETEREAIAGERSDSYRYKTRTYLRNRLEKVERDIDVLEEHAPELLEELRDTVCETSTEPGDHISTTAADSVAQDSADRDRVKQSTREPTKTRESDKNNE